MRTTSLSNKLRKIANIVLNAVTTDTLEKMRSFGLMKGDIDREGFITVYHGGLTLPKRLRKDEIFFLTPSREVAEDYANMRGKGKRQKGKVFTLRVRPDDITWNEGSGELEFDRGGKIIGDKIKPNAIAKSNSDSAQGITLPRSGFTIIDSVRLPNGRYQLQLQTPNSIGWYDGETTLAYEYPDEQEREEIKQKIFN